MPLEIERKFLVTDASWREQCTKSERLRDGLVAVSDGLKVRVRLYEDRATLAIKTKRVGGVRDEYEYEIPRSHAEELLATHCGYRKLEKTRHHVQHEGFQWIIDIYEGILKGVIIAEVELERPDAHVPLPKWVGREVTNDPRYTKLAMLLSEMERRAKQ
jgi:adenylate cyclase